MSFQSQSSEASLSTSCGESSDEGRLSSSNRRRRVSFAGVEEAVEGLDIISLEEQTPTRYSSRKRMSSSSAKMVTASWSFYQPTTSLPAFLGAAGNVDTSSTKNVDADAADDEDDEAEEVRQGLKDLQRWSQAADMRRMKRSVATCKGTLNPELNFKSSGLWQKRRQSGDADSEMLAPVSKAITV
mmetsp:Transcript_42725/g.91646  ORF Transcript_42725/g.91646 Transcript_42725/m.91646 type:complete len:185 (-) Transcript_42725:382-936(-)|eukprot:CAMPEP_0206503170 /NCGR_PEP_ID=MMETSP0324_2-20121206/54516_1 /ASSEMBLY_ACC=CAM_ASM_000836 /TAXON_ID=2866 /ORGANISM="Crypthecodinium cohnii, Strain Seligo" /LENGTH=184 /DNA_ID=CAMNT_0053991669 /DNA_START=101 /DNA_END=655 /DNA_ORIENTATION=+